MLHLSVGETERARAAAEDVPDDLLAFPLALMMGVAEPGALDFLKALPVILKDPRMLEGVFDKVAELHVRTGRAGELAGWVDGLPAGQQRASACMAIARAIQYAENGKPGGQPGRW